MRYSDALHDGTICSTEEEAERLPIYVRQLKKLHYVHAPFANLTLGKERIGHTHSVADLALAQAEFFSRFYQTREENVVCFLVNSLRALRDLRVSAALDLITSQVRGRLDDFPNKEDSKYGVNEG